MAKPLTSWLVPSFSQHNIRLVVSRCCLHVSDTKFWDKFASLRQVNSPNSWKKFQICRTDIDKISTEFRGILRVFVNLAAWNWLWAASFTLYKLATKNLHLATIFLQLVHLRIFLISSPNQDKLLVCRPFCLWLVPLPSMGGGGGVLIFTPRCFMVLPTKISSHCAGPLACFKCLSHPWGEGVEF